jgi:hypothetical protein
MGYGPGGSGLGAAALSVDMGVVGGQTGTTRQIQVPQTLEVRMDNTRSICSFGKGTGGA